MASPTARPATVTGYLAAQPAPARAALRRVRATLRAALPGAEEIVSYGIPAYRLGGRVVLFFAGWKAHWSLYPASAALVAALGEALGPFAVAKGTLRFPLDRPVPVGLVRRIARLRAREVAGPPARRPAARKRRTA